MPCIVRDMGDDEAVIAMVDSNLQREAILPSERAFAYSMRLEAMKRQGRRTDLTCAQVAHKSDGRRSRDILAEELGVSKDKVQRFIRLTHLIPELLALVDEGRMKMLPAVEASHLSQGEQAWLLGAMEAQACTPSHVQVRHDRRQRRREERLIQHGQKRAGQENRDHHDIALADTHLHGPSLPSVPLANLND